MVHFIGHTQFGGDKIWIGVVLETPHGLNDGSKNGIAYFECKPMHGLFVRAKMVHVKDPPTQEEIEALEDDLGSDSEEDAEEDDDDVVSSRMSERGAASGIDDGGYSSVPRRAGTDSVEGNSRFSHGSSFASGAGERTADVADEAPKPFSRNDSRLDAEAAAAWQRAKHADAMQRLRRQQAEEQARWANPQQQHTDPYHQRSPFFPAGSRAAQVRIWRCACLQFVYSVACIFEHGAHTVTSGCTLVLLCW